MSRKLVIFICSLNVLLGVGVLWFVLTPRKSPIPNTLQPSAKTDAPAYSDTELWTKAQEASTARVAYGYLQQITSNSDTSNQSAKQIDRLVESATAPFKNWPYFEALIQFHGNRSESLNDLEPLRRLALQTDQALTLRNLAFRSYIENFIRLDTAAPESAYTLIDTLLNESNSLSATAMQAERFLREKEIKRSIGSADEDILANRAEAALLDPAALILNRLAAANILSWLGELPDSREIQKAFNSTDSERLKVALLQLLAASNPADADLVWLESIQPTTPEQEQLVQSIIEE